MAHQDYGRVTSGSAHPSSPLPGGHDGTRIPDQNAQIQFSDIDPQFQRTGTDDGQQLSRCQIAFNFASFFGQVSGPIRADSVGQGSGFLGSPQRNEFCHFSGLGEDQGA